MTPADLVHAFVNTALSRDIESAKQDLIQQRNFVNFGKAELIFAVDEVVAEAREDKSCKHYLAIVFMGIAAFALATYIVISPFYSDLKRIIFCGIAGVSAVLIRQYYVFFREPALKAKKVREICSVLLNSFDAAV